MLTSVKPDAWPVHVETWKAGAVHKSCTYRECIYTDWHVSTRWVMTLHFLAFFECWAFNCIYWFLSRTGHVSQSSFVGRHQEHSIFQHVYLHVLRARHVSACGFAFQNWVSINMCWSQELCVSPTSVFTCWELSKFLHVPGGIQGYVWFSKRGPVSRAEKVSACLGAHWGLVMIQDVLTCIGSWACICMCSRAGYATLRVSACVEKVVPATLNGLYRRLCVYLHAFACFKCCIGIFIWCHV